MKHLPLLLSALLWTPALLVTQTQQPACPDKGVDPSTFVLMEACGVKKIKNVWVGMRILIRCFRNMLPTIR